MSEAANLSPVASVMLKTLTVSYPDPVTISPKTETDEKAILELTDREFIELWDMWPNGDRRWMATAAGLRFHL